MACDQRRLYGRLRLGEQESREDGGGNRHSDARVIVEEKEIGVPDKTESPYLVFNT